MFLTWSYVSFNSLWRLKMSSFVRSILIRNISLCLSLSMSWVIYFEQHKDDVCFSSLVSHLLVLYAHWGVQTHSLCSCWYWSSIWMCNIFNVFLSIHNVLQIWISIRHRIYCFVQLVSRMSKAILRSQCIVQFVPYTIHIHLHTLYFLWLPFWTRICVHCIRYFHQW